MLLVLALLVGGACRADLEVAVTARPDGGGRVQATVTLDADAVAQLPDLAGDLRVDDLRQAGWEVTGPRPHGDGGAEIVASKPYSSAAEAAAVVAELAGPAGPFRDFRVEQERSFLRTRTSFLGTVDLSAGLDGFSDDALRERLGGSGLGLTPEQLEARLGGSPDRVFAFRVVAALPGKVESNAPGAAGGPAVWEPKLGEQLSLVASSERLNRANIGLAAAGVLAGLALLVVLGVRLLRRGGTRAASWS